jgi:effector-binding domain-containing protein
MNPRLLDVPSIHETTELHTAQIRLTIAKDEIRSAMGPAISEVFATIGKQGLAPQGGWFLHHHKIDDSGWDFDVCVPVDRPVAAEGRVVAGAWPSMRVLRAVYAGPYEGLGDAWGEFDAWAKSAGIDTQRDLWERDLVGPESVSDATQYRTELTRPIAVTK